jgi:rhodanese-related sulfurtransferase
MSQYPSNQPIAQITVEEFASYLTNTTTKPQLIDVREPEELAIAKLNGFVNLPLSQFSEWAPQIDTILDPYAETIVMCHHGVRSAQMCHWLVQQGFLDVKNLSGGIAAYANRIDPTLAQY